MGYCSSFGTGAYVASEKHQAFYGHTARFDGTKRAVIFHAGHAQQVPLSAIPTPDATTYTLGAKRAVALTCDFVDGKQWGNDTVQSRITSAWTYAKNTWGAKTDKVVLWGASMGTLCVLNWARANPTLVAAVCLEIPAVDLQDLHDNNRGGYATEIETAYGGAGAYATARTAHNPAENAASYSGMPITMFYSSDDPLAIPSAVTTFAATAGATTVNMGAVGHAFNTAYSQQKADFMASYV